MGYVVCCCSHIQHIGCQPDRTTSLHGNQSRSQSAEQRKNNKKRKFGSTAPPHAARTEKTQITWRVQRREQNEENKIRRRTDDQKGHLMTHLHACLGAMQVSVRFASVQDLFGSSTRQIEVASQVLRFRVRSQLFQSICLSLFLADSSRDYLFFPPRGHKSPPTFRDCLNPYLCLRRRRSPIPRYAKHLDVDLYAVGPLSLLPTLFSPHFTLKVSQHGSLWQPPTAHSNKRPHPQKSSCAQRRLNALIPGYLKGMVVRGHPMVWYLVVCPDDTKQDPVVYVTEFGVVFLAKGSRTASIQ